MAVIDFFQRLPRLYQHVRPWQPLIARYLPDFDMGLGWAVDQHQAKVLKGNEGAQHY